MMNSMSPSHDDFIRKIFSNKKMAIAYLKSFLPKSLLKKLKLSSLTFLPDTYISEQLKKTISDIVFSCATRNGKDVRICFLLEHKSNPDKYTPVQIGGYIFSGLSQQIENEGRLSLIIPILIYHGKQNWPYTTLKDILEPIDPELQKFIPDFDFIFNNLGELTDAEIKALNNKFLAASFLAFKHHKDKEWIEQNALSLLLFAADGPPGLRKGFVIYLYSRGKFDEKILNSLPDTIKSDIMNTLDIYFEKGIEKGIEKGMEKGIAKGKQDIIRNLIHSGKMSVSEIANMTGEPESFIRQVKRSIQRKN